MMTAYQIDMRRSTVISILLHLGVLLIIALVSLWQPFTPREFQFEDVEIIDTETFDALVATTQAGSSGQDTADAPTQAQTADTEPAEEVAPEEETPAPPPTPTPPQVNPEPSVQPEALPEPIFRPQDEVEAQPLPQVEQAQESGIADPESQGREQASQVTTLDAPPPRDAAQLRQIAQEAQDQATQSPREEVTVTDAQDAQADVDTQTPSEVDATSQIVPEAQEDAPISAAPQVAIAPPARPANLAPPAPPAPAVEAVEAEPTDVPSDAQAEAQETPDETPETPADQNLDTAATDGAPADVNDTGATDAPVDGSAEDASIDDLLASVLEEQDGTQSSGRGLSRAEQAAVTQKIHNNWVKSTIIEKDNYENLIVTVGFQTDRFGNLVGDVELIQPNRPTNDHLVAFQAARRAVLNSMPLSMPPDIDPSGVIWQLTFNPSPTAGGIY